MSRKPTDTKDLTTEMMLSSNLDQPLQFNPKPLFEEIDKRITESIQIKNPDHAMEIAVGIIKATRVAAIGMAKLLWNIRKRWEEFEINQNFSDYIFEAVGLSSITVQRYLNTWDMFEDDEFPQEFRDSLLQRGIKDLNAIATTYASGYKFTAEDWQALVDAEDNASVLARIHQIKHTDPQRNWLQLKIGRDGSLKAYTKNDIIIFGYLNIDDAEENETIRRAVDRVLNNSQITRE